MCGNAASHLYVMLCLATAAAAQEPRFEAVVLDDSYIAYERDVGDIDGDGDNDLVAIHEGETKLEVFRAPEWKRSTLVTFEGENRYPRADDLKLADLDGDGDVDIVTRLGNGPTSAAAGIAVWCENLEGGSKFVQHLIGESHEYVKDIVVADFDRDRRPDIAMRMDSKAQIWLRDGRGWSEVLLSHPPHEGMEAEDVDGDGDPDLVLNGYWFVTPDTPEAARDAAQYARVDIDRAWFDQTGDWTKNSCKVVVGDFDGDARNDVAFSHSERPGFAVAWYRSEAPREAGSWRKHDVGVVDYCHTLQAADWDLDGDTDLLVGGMIQSRHRGLKLMRNEGGGGTWKEHVIQTEGSYSAEAGDIDNDGDPDIMGIRNWNSPPSYIYRNTTPRRAGPASWTYHAISDSHVRTFGLCFSDVDGDGDIDVASGPFVYRNPGAPLTGEWNRARLPDGVHAFAAVHVDGDDRADLIAQRDDPAASRLDLYWLEAESADGAKWTAPIRIGEVPRSDHPEGFQGYRVAQIVAGGRPEIVVSTMKGVYFFTIPDDAAAGGWPRTFVAANDSDEGIGVADLDGDGDLDIGFTSGKEKAVKWARNPGDGRGGWSVYTVGSFPEADWPDRCEAADLNGDGRVDLIVTEENRGTEEDALACWWEQPASGATSREWRRHAVATRFTLNSLGAADMDMDGDVDLVLAEHRGDKRIEVWENDGRGTLVERPVGRGAESHLGARAVDLDGDGDLDLVSIAYDGFRGLHLWRHDAAPRE
jgi:hypothetical protein